MNESTLVLVAVLLGGVLLMVLLGCLNPFVPKRYRRMVKKVHEKQIETLGKEIPIEMRYDSSIYLGISLVLVVAATVVRIFVKYSSVAAYFARGGWQVVASIGFWVLIVAVMEILYVMMAFLAETMVIQSTENYYRKLGFRAVDVRQAEPHN